jgi:hypothetical protein
MPTFDILGALLEYEFGLAVHCENPFCRHRVDLDLAALAERLGRDFVCIGKPNPLTAKMVCSKCGSKDLGLILSPVTGYTNGPPNAVLPYGGPGGSPVPVKTRRSRRRVRL